MIAETSTDRAAFAHTVLVALEEAIRYRLTNRRWYRANRNFDWKDLERENAQKLRALLEVHRNARRLHKAIPEPWELRKARYDAWQDQDGYSAVLAQYQAESR